VGAVRGRAATARIRARGSSGASGNGRLGESISKARRGAQIIVIATETIDDDDVSNGKA
jgi:hypothetical protein